MDGDVVLFKHGELEVIARDGGEYCFIEGRERDIPRALIECAKRLDHLRRGIENERQLSDEQTATLRAQLAEAVAQRDDLLRVAEDWRYYADEVLPEFYDEGEEPCASERLCPKCEPAGCIDMKVRATLRAIARARQPKPATGDVDARDDVHEARPEAHP